MNSPPPGTSPGTSDPSALALHAQPKTNNPPTTNRTSKCCTCRSFYRKQVMKSKVTILPPETHVRRTWALPHITQSSPQVSRSRLSDTSTIKHPGPGPGQASRPHATSPPPSRQFNNLPHTPRITDMNPHQPANNFTTVGCASLNATLQTTTHATCCNSSTISIQEMM